MVIISQKFLAGRKDAFIPLVANLVKRSGEEVIAYAVTAQHKKNDFVNVGSFNLAKKGEK